MKTRRIKSRNLLDIQADLMRSGEMINEAVTVTKSENKLGQALIDAGVQVLPDWKIGGNSFDFKVFHYPILIEVDGGVHKERHVRIKDYRKERFVQRKGYRIMRFCNQEVHSHTDRCVREVKELISCCGVVPQEIWLYKVGLSEQLRHWFKIRKKINKLCYWFKKLKKKK